MSLSQQFTADFLNAIFGDPSLVEPVQVWIALSTADPGDDGSGFSEVTGTGYGRQQITAAGMNAAVPGTPSTKTNGSSIVFGPSGAAWSGSASITHVALYDASTGTTRFLGGGALVPAQTVDGASQTVTVSAGNLSLTLD